MITLEEISELIATRRMIAPAMFTAEKIEDEVVQQLLQNANWAPTHRKTEPWRFHVFSGTALEKLGDHFQQIYKTHMSAEAFSDIKYKKLKDKTSKSSHVIAICMQRDPNESVPEWEEIASVACAVQNIWLSATAAGLGGYWSSPNLMMEHFGALVDMAVGERCLGFFYLGIPKTEIVLQGKRGTAEDKVKWHM